MAKRKKGEQGFLPDMEPKKHPRLHKLALSYVRVRDERMEMTTEEVKAHDMLLAAMQDEGIFEYEYGDIKVKMNSTHKVKVKKANDDSNGSEEREANGDEE